MKTFLGLMVVMLINLAAATADELAIPAPLKEWQQWALKGQEFRRCPISYGQAGADAEQFICTWFGALKLSVTKSGAQFELPIEIFRDGFVPLPGDEQNWPNHVKQQSGAIAVVAKDGLPQVYLTAGRYVLSGDFSWRERPAQLTVPTILALVNLTIDGSPVNFIRRDGSSIGLGVSTEKQTEQDSLDLQVYRLIQDGLPFVNETRVHLKVTGRAREAVLGKAMLDGFVALDLQSELASKLDNNGVLTVQLLPGEWQITLRTRAEQLPAQLKRSASDHVWPADEIWSFESNDALRAVSFEGGQPVDPQQVEVPEEWWSFAAQRVTPDNTVSITERARGTQDLRNHLNWQRDLWLRFDGSRFAFVDQINGSMRSDWRLNAQNGVQLLSAEVDGEPQPITETQDKSASGVELRDQNVQVRSSGELANDNTMPASGWQHSFDQAALRLHLPPGYQLLGASGVDVAEGSFLSQWNLLDCFILVLTTAIIFRLLGPIWAVVGALAFASLFHHYLMPTWLVLNAVAAVLIAQFAEGKLALWLNRFRNVSLAALILWSLPFIASQVRSILHPQLEDVPYVFSNSTGYNGQNAMMDQAMSSAAPELKLTGGVEARQKLAKPAQPQADIIEVVGARIDSYDRYGQSSINQAGNGIPSWQWKTYALSWQGPLSAEQTLSLYIVSRPLNALWQGAALIGFMALLAMIFRRAMGKTPWQMWRQSGGVAALLILSLGAVSPRSDADMPSNDLLNELRTRLTAPPTCAPSCVDVSDAQISVEQNRLTITMTVHALFDSALPLPGRGEEWTASTILRDGQPASLHQINDQWHIALSKGVHRVQLSGVLPSRNRVSVQFPAMPRFVSVNTNGWEVMGLDGNRLPSGALDLLRSATQSQSNKIAENQVSIAPFVRVHRHLYMGLDWSTETVVERIAPTQAAFSIAIPLAPNEALSSSTLRVQDGQVLLNFAAGEMEKRYQAKLPRVNELQWQDARADLVAEWSIYPSAMWRVTHAGTPLITRDDDPSILHFVPRADEKLALAISRPNIVTGNTIAYDAVALNETIGQRQRNGSLSLNYRATQGGEQRLQLSNDMQVNNVLSDGRALIQRPQNGVLSFNVTPGQHVIQVDYEREQDISPVTHLPTIALPLSAANIQVSVNIPNDRWIIWTHGPLLGPVVLYWSALVVFIALAWAVARARITALKTRDLLLLGLGLSTVSWMMLAGLIAWLALMHRHNQRAISDDERLSRFKYNARQLFLSLFSMSAVIALISSVPSALLSSPDMMLSGNQSYGNQLHWFADFTTAELPNVIIVSVPLWVYKGLMLLWAIWLSFALISWLRHAWHALNRNEFWRGKIIKATEVKIESDGK